MILQYLLGFASALCVMDTILMYAMIMKIDIKRSRC